MIGRRLGYAGDLALILATALAAIWLPAHNYHDVEALLGFPSTAWMGHHNMAEQPVRPGFAPVSARLLYARDHPRSPLAWFNALPGVHAVENLAENLVYGQLAIPTLASVTLGLVAVRRPGPRPRRRWGPGRVAAAIGLIVTAAALVNDFVLRRVEVKGIRLNGYQDLGDAVIHSWITSARIVGVATLAAWVLIALGGRWRFGRGWREWLGLLLGATWLAILAWTVVLEPLAQLD